MLIFNKIIALSKQIASSLLRDEQPTSLEDSEIFNKSDKAYILKNLTDESLIKERVNLVNQIDEQKEWKKIKNKIDTPVRKLYWRYAAAAILIGILATGYYLRKDTFNNSIESTSIMVNHTIKVGSDKATLTLEDGTNITLEKGQQYISDHLESNGEEIIYKLKNKSKSKIIYNYLTIPRGGQYYIKLSDGTEVWLNSESQLKYPVSFIDGETRQVELVYGEAYFDVSPSTNHKGSKFNVRNQNQDVEVLGTEFNIKAYKEEENIFTTLVDGKVTVSNFISKQVLVPNQQSIINIESKDISVNTVDVNSETSWRRGLFSFKSKPLKEIMIVLSRWYDFDFVFTSSDLEKVRFNGVLSKKDDLEELLKIIKNTNYINAYEITDKKLQ